MYVHMYVCMYVCMYVGMYRTYTWKSVWSATSHLLYWATQQQPTKRCLSWGQKDEL